MSRFVDGLEAGNYRTNVESVLGRWREWTAANRSVEQLAELEVLDCRRFAAYLKSRSREGGISPSTARTYYAYVRSFLSWCVDEELLGRNPATATRATDELPEDIGDTERQFWTPEAREKLIKYVSDRAHDALEGESVDRRLAFRDRALVAMLALTGVRGAEIARAPRDHRREGLRWRNVDLEGRSMEVLGKSREVEQAPLPGEVCDVLERWRRVQDPESDDWPVFPTRHRPTLAALEEGEDPPSITVDGVRGVMERLCEEARIDIDGEYLKPHGGRRGVGDLLYRENASLAQAALRHRSIETTHESYSDIRAGEVAEQMDDVLGG